MPRKTAPPTGMRDAYRYSPGDGHTYTWDGTSEYAVVYRHQAAVTGPQDGSRIRLQLEATGDAILMTGCARTATAFADRVDRWRARPRTAAAMVEETGP